MVNSWIILYYNYIILYYILIFGDAHQSVINPLTVINIHIKRIDGWPYQPYTMFWPWHIHLANSHLRPRNYVKFVAHRNGSSWKQRFDSHSAVDTAFIIICIYIYIYSWMRCLTFTMYACFWVCSIHPILYRQEAWKSSSHHHWCCYPQTRCQGFTCGSRPGGINDPYIAMRIVYLHIHA